LTKEIVFTSSNFPSSVDFSYFVEILGRVIETLENSIEFLDPVELRDAADDVLDVYEQLKSFSQLTEVAYARELLKESLDIIECAIEDCNPWILEEGVEKINKAIKHLEDAALVVGERISNEFDRPLKYMAKKELILEDQKQSLKVFRSLFMRNMAKALNTTTEELLKFISEVSGFIEMFALTYLVAKFLLEESERFVLIREDNGLLLKVVRKSSVVAKARIMPVNKVHYTYQQTRMIQHGEMIIVDADKALNVLIQLLPTAMGLDVYISIGELIRR